jgi:hypothetical protein
MVDWEPEPRTRELQAGVLVQRGRRHRVLRSGSEASVRSVQRVQVEASKPSWCCRNPRILAEPGPCACTVANLFDFRGYLTQTEAKGSVHVISGIMTGC